MDIYKQRKKQIVEFKGILYSNHTLEPVLLYHLIKKQNRSFLIQNQSLCMNLEIVPSKYVTGKKLCRDR